MTTPQKDDAPIEISTRYRVRKMTSGYNGISKFFVYDLVRPALRGGYRSGW